MKKFRLVVGQKPLLVEAQELERAVLKYVGLLCDVVWKRRFDKFSGRCCAADVC